MNTLPPLASDEHVEALVPWYVNGTLDAAGTQLVQRHLQGCEQCRASVELETKISGLVREHRDTLDCAPQSGWSRLVAHLDGRKSPLHEKSAPSRLRRRTRGKRLIPALLILQAAAIAGLGVALIYVLDNRTDVSYQTLSDATQIPSAASPTLRVVFADSTTTEKLRTLLEPIGGTIRSGPTTNSAYTIELQQSGTAAALKWLRTQPEVLFAEPAGAPQDH